MESLRNPAQSAAWNDFDARFRPLLTSFALRLGLDSSEAEDVAQETLVEFVSAYQAGQYDRTRGRLSSWIIGIAQNRIVRRRAAVGRAATHPLESDVRDLNDSARLSAVWEDEERRLIIIRAMEALRAGRTEPKTLLAFELVAIRGVPADEAARQCGMTVDDVYSAKNRVGKRLREIIDELTAAWQECG